MFERQQKHSPQRSSRQRLTSRLAVVLASTCLLASVDGVCAEDSSMRLRLKDSSFAVGRVVASEQPNTLGWQIEGFESPFFFDIRSVQSASLIASDNDALAQQGHFFELQDGAMISGTLQAMDADWVTIESPLLGEVRVARSSVVSLVDAGYAGELIYSGPRDDKSWVEGEPLGNDPNWDFEAGALVAKRQGVAIVGNVDLPNRSQISLTMSWKGSPDFVLSLGTNPSKSPSASEPVLAAARLEVWDKQLALLREVDDSADIELLAELAPSNPRIELTVYLDQEAGIVVVCDAHGRPLDRMTLPAKNKSVQPAIQLVNHGPSLTLERLEVREWDGVTTIGGTGSGIVLGDSNEVIAATIVGFNESTQELQLETEDGRSITLPISELRRGDFGAAQTAQEPKAAVLPPAVPQPPQLSTQPETQPDTLKPEGNADGATKEAGSETPVAALASEATSLFDSLAPVVATPTEATNEPSVVEVVWTDRTRLKGLWLPSVDGKLQFEATGLAAPFSFDPQLVRGIIGTQDRYAADLTLHKNGTLKIGETELAGFLEEDSPQLGQRALYWHPHGSQNASAISDTAEGAIIYRKTLPKVTRGKATADAQQADAIAAPIVQIFLGGGNRPNSSNNVTPSTSSNSRANANDEREIVFRSGDAIDGIVKRIDETGVLFESSESQTAKATHEQMQSVWLNRQRRELEISPEKLERLMTVPRSMKADPPTHLFISVLGDFLRGRLVSLDEQKVTIEVRLEMVELPKDQIAQIVWLHDRDWSNEKKPKKDAGDEATAAANPEQAAPNAPEPFRVHVFKASGRGLTFEPSAINAGVLTGSSDLLGACTVEVSSLNQLLFGRNIATQLREYNEDPWKLSLAQYPRVFLDDNSAEGGSAAGANSPMVGELATDFGLKQLDGETFRLSKARDRVVVLDFWASWCGPCIQTMPLVEEVVKEIGEDKVHLVAVNIQEAPARVQAAVERLGLTATVVLDRDGEAAAAYAANAIPQTVIIDQEGKVTHVFVGGGAKFVAQFRKALEEVAQ
jgi:thiol-disulfide isomerase/thioredoxin